MEFERFRILAALWVVAAAAGALPLQEDTKNGGTGINYRLPGNIVPRHYSIKLIPYIREDNFTFDGASSIDIEVKTVTSNVILHALELTIDENATSLVSQSGEIFMPKEHVYDATTEILTIKFEKPLNPGIYTINMEYNGILNDDLSGFYRSSYVNEDNETVWLATTHFEPTEARRAFPCWDEPALKATFNISIKHHVNYTALSNMPELETSVVDEADGKVWTQFQTTPPMSTYLVAFVVSDFVNISNADGTVNVWCRRNALGEAKYILEIAEKAAVQLERYTNSTVRVPKMDHVAIPDFQAGAMENWGLITYAESSFFFNDNSSSNVVKQTVAVVVTHELAHQWFGNVVSPAWWSYVWLNEGFAAYFENYILDMVESEWQLMHFFAVHDLQRVFSYDDTKYSQPINSAVVTPKDAELKFSAITYEKTASVLRMLSHIVTEDVFRAGLVNYLSTHEYKAATPDNLWAAIQSALDKSNVTERNNVNVKEVMDTWIVQHGYPLVTVRRSNETGVIRVTQEVFRRRRRHGEFEDLQDYERSDEDDSRKWFVPINYATRSHPDFSSTSPTVWLRPQDQQITIENVDANDWIILNVQQAGYYRVNYDAVGWQKIAKYLNSDKFTNIHPMNRAQILNDVYYLMRGGLVNPTTFMEVTNYLSRESDYIPWHPAFQMIASLKQYTRSSHGHILKKVYPTEVVWGNRGRSIADILFGLDGVASEIQRSTKVVYYKNIVAFASLRDVEDRHCLLLRPQYDPHILSLMRAVIESTGFEERPDDDHSTKLKRVHVFRWACYFGHPNCRKTAARTLAAYLEDPVANKISPNLKGVTLHNGIRGANETIWNKIFDGYVSKGDAQILYSLGRSENATIIEKYMTTAMTKNSPINKEHRLDAFKSVFHGDCEVFDAALDFVIKNWNTIKTRVPRARNMINMMIGDIHKMEHVEKMRTFLKANKIDDYEELLSYVEEYVVKLDKIVSKFMRWLEKDCVHCNRRKL